MNKLLLCAAPALLIAGRLHTDYSADRSLTVERKITTTSEVVDMVMIVDGEEMEGRGFGGGGSESTLTITTTDKVLAHAEGAPTRVQRTIDTLSTEGVMMMREEEREFERSSDAEGVVMELGIAENGDREVKVVEGEEPEGASFASLELTLELDALLPEGEVSAGDTWELESDAVLRGLGFGLERAMFGRPSFGGERPEGGPRGGGGGRRGGMMGGRGGFSLQSALELEWEGEATMTDETEDVDGTEGVVIELTFEADGALPEREWGGGRGGRGGGMALSSPLSTPIETTVEIELEGRLVWSTKENRPLLLELKGDFVSEMNRTMSRGDREMEMSSTTEGTVEIEVNVSAN